MVEMYNARPWFVSHIRDYYEKKNIHLPLMARIKLKKMFLIAR